MGRPVLSRIDESMIDSLKQGEYQTFLLIDSLVTVDCPVSLYESRVFLQHLLMHRYGLFGKESKTLQAISDLFAYRDRQYMSVVVKKALRLLRHPTRRFLSDGISSKMLYKDINGEYPI